MRSLSFVGLGKPALSYNSMIWSAIGLLSKLYVMFILLLLRVGTRLPAGLTSYTTYETLNIF